MRRKEFIPQAEEEVDAFLQEMDHGFLGTVDGEGRPHVTPLNYVYWGGHIYFHGSRIGRKIEQLRERPAVSFAIAKPYAIIPSYFTDPKFACPATTFFKSVLIEGTAVIVEDVREKAQVMTAFMEKLQPEGGYAPIDPDDREYLPRIRGVAVVKIEGERRSAKFKFGQNKNEATLQNIAQGLAKRAGELDIETIRQMQTHCPHFQMYNDGADRMKS